MLIFNLYQSYVACYNLLRNFFSYLIRKKNILYFNQWAAFNLSWEIWNGLKLQKNVMLLLLGGSAVDIGHGQIRSETRGYNNWSRGNLGETRFNFVFPFLTCLSDSIPPRQALTWSYGYHTYLSVYAPHK